MSMIMDTDTDYKVKYHKYKKKYNDLKRKLSRSQKQVIKLDLDISDEEALPDTFDDIVGEKPFDADVVVNNRHRGQRKLFLSELDFITEKYIEGANVVYIGSSPGYHITKIAKMFPSLTFYLYDNRKNEAKGDNIVFKQMYMTADEAKVLRKVVKSKPILFISDIRSMTADTPEQFELDVMSDLQLQLDVARLLQPMVSMFKFRLPFNKTKIKYVDGVIKLQVWAGKTSAETRLWVSDLDKERIYNGKEYEEKMFYFNTVMRPNGYDQNKEREIYQKYKNKFTNRRKHQSS